MPSDAWLDAYKQICKSNNKEIPKCILDAVKEVAPIRPDGLRTPVTTSQIRVHLTLEWNFSYVDGWDVRRAMRQLVSQGLAVEIKTPHPNNYGGHKWELL